MKTTKPIDAKIYDNVESVYRMQYYDIITNPRWRKIYKHHLKNCLSPHFSETSSDFDEIRTPKLIRTTTKILRPKLQNFWQIDAMLYVVVFGHMIQRIVRLLQNFVRL